MMIPAESVYQVTAAFFSCRSLHFDTSSEETTR